MTAIWACLILLVPFAGFTTRIGLRHLPVLLLFMLAGVVRQRALSFPPPAASAR